MLVLCIVLFSISFVASAGCDPSISLINQDPYPAVPGDSVKLVFQVDNVDNPECGDIEFKLLEEYPFTLDQGSKSVYNINPTYVQEHTTYLMAPFTIRVDENALDGDTPIEVGLSFTGPTFGELSEKFDVSIEDVKADFEITIKNYEATTNTLTLEILNIGKSDIEALTLEIPEQENIIVKGSYRNIVGDLDSNDYTTADFESIPADGEIMVSVLYTDSINVRRNLQKTITFNSQYFEDRNGTGNGTSIWTYIIILIVIGAVFWWWRRRKKKQAAHSHRH
ncbi:LPXTG cell wall anchor domain-containing protein, partial [archaeon]|nr:LPXTG cell wall anchor domain-containing protein [archaeon]